MSTTPAAVEPLLDQARDDPEIVAVLLFGSRARGEHHPESDIDIVLVVRAGADAFEKRIAYGYAPGIDVQVFQALPLHVRMRVVAEARPLLMKDEDAWYTVALAAWREWQDFGPFVRQYLEGAGVG